jgi:SAM-dependent methyltransferase
MTAVLSSAYNKFYRSGVYYKRYPEPNQRVLSVLLAKAVNARAILDLGCGSGRYILPLLRGTSANVTGCDISRTALDQVKLKLADNALLSRVDLVHGTIDAIDPAARFDLVCCLFGTLSYMLERTDRLRTLRSIARSLSNDKASLVISVPNAYRRFYREQRSSARAGRHRRDIQYHRQLEDDKVFLPYHLYTRAELISDLKEVGFTRIRVMPESIVPESVVTNSKLYGTLDRVCCSFMPANLGYGLLAIATC